MMILTDDTLSGRPVTTNENAIPSRAVEETEIDCGNKELLIKSNAENNLRSFFNFIIDEVKNHILEIILN